MALISHVPWLAPVFHRLPVILPILQRMRGFAIHNATNRIKSGGSSRDIWHYLVRLMHVSQTTLCLTRLYSCKADEAGIENEKPELQDVIPDAVLVIIAGYDTIATALTALFWFLLKNPQCYKRLQMEIDTTYPDHADPLLTPVPPSKLAYLNACMLVGLPPCWKLLIVLICIDYRNETLRLHPPVPTSGPRQVPYTVHDKVVAEQ